MSTDVLFVDDEGEAAGSYAELVQRRTGLSTAHTDSRAEALRIVRAESVKVVVLDQRMESGELLKTRGTALFEEIHGHDSRIRCLIFSGQSRPKDHEEIHDQWGRVKFLPKSELEKLPARVLRLYQEYDGAVFADYQRQGQPFGQHRHWLSRPAVRFELLAEEDIGEPEYSHEDFRSMVEVHGGQLQERRALRSVDTEIQIEDEKVDEIQAAGMLGLAVLDELRARLSKSARKRTQASRRDRGEVETKVVETITETDLKRGVTLRKVEEAPYYRRRRAIIRTHCSCCGGTRVVMIPFREPAGRFHRRQTFVFSNGTTETVDLGAFDEQQ